MARLTVKCVKCKRQLTIIEGDIYSKVDVVEIAEAAYGSKPLCTTCFFDENPMTLRRPILDVV